jgi:transcriptional regulator with XRE-family HTH domain
MRASKDSIISRRVEWLFKSFLKPDGSEYNHHEVEEGTAALGHRVTAGAIWKIRHGHTPNPGFLTLRALAQFFGIKPGFFYEDGLNECDLEQIKSEAVLRDSKVQEIALRASELAPEDRDVILGMIRLIARRQGLE